MKVYSPPLSAITRLLADATDGDAAEVAALRLAVSYELTARFGVGTWSFAAESDASVRADIASSRVLIGRQAGAVVATLRLATRNPWLGDTSFFTPRRLPLFLTSMAVAPHAQRQGIGRICLEDVKRIAFEWGADAIRLDAYDAPAGAGDFYRKCGFREARRAPYNGTPLIFFEYLVG